MVDVTLQDVEVTPETVEDLVILRVRDEQIRLNVCLTGLQICALLAELASMGVTV